MISGLVSDQRIRVFSRAVKSMATAIAAKAEAWKDIVKIGRTHMQDATSSTRCGDQPLTDPREVGGGLSAL
jgi:fumarate hydratase class II